MSTISVPDDLYEKALDFARAQRISVDEVFAAAFADQLAAWNHLEERAARGNREQFLEVLDKAPSIPPSEQDRL